MREHMTLPSATYVTYDVTYRQINEGNIKWLNELTDLIVFDHETRLVGT